MSDYAEPAIRRMQRLDPLALGNHIADLEDRLSSTTTEVERLRGENEALRNALMYSDGRSMYVCEEGHHFVVAVPQDTCPWPVGGAPCAADTEWVLAAYDDVLARALSPSTNDTEADGDVR